MINKNGNLNEVGAEVGAAAWVEAQTKITYLQQQVLALELDRDVLAEARMKQEQLLQWIAREASLARHYARENERKNTLITIQHKIERQLRP